MTLKEYIIERLSDYPIIEMLNEGGYLDKQFKDSLSNIYNLFIERANKNGSIKQYVKNDISWNMYLDQYKTYFALPEIIELDNLAYKVLPNSSKSAKENQNEKETIEDKVKYNADGKFDELDKDSKDIITGRIFICSFIKLYSKLLMSVSKEKVIEDFIIDSDKDSNVVLTIIKILLIYISQNNKPLLDLDTLFLSKEKDENKVNNLTPELIQIILYTFIIEDMKAAGIDNKTVGKLQNYMGIK